MSFAGTFERYREGAGLSVNEVAERCGFNRQYAYNIRNGQVVPTNNDTLTRIAEAIGAPRDEVFVAANKIPPEVEAWIKNGGLKQVRVLMEEGK